MKLSLVIPTSGRGDLLKECLESVFNQGYPYDDYEVIVVSDGRADLLTKTLADSYSKRFRHFKFIELTQAQGPAAARNRGVKEASGGVIGFTDDDCLLEPDWFRRVLESHARHETAALIGGLTRVKPGAMKLAVSQALSDGAIRTEINGKEETIFFPTCNVSFKRDRLDGHRFNELFSLPAGEDMEFCWRLFKSGRRFVYDPAIKVFHNRRNSLRAFLKQAYSYGRGNYLVQYLHRDHPFFKEIKVDDWPLFMGASLLNFLKIPRFSYLMTKRLLKDSLTEKTGWEKRAKIYFYFSLHKMFYIAGNFIEHRRTRKKASRKEVLCPQKPEFIILDLTHRCNLACNICEIRKDPGGRELATREVFDLIAQADAWGVKEFVLSGGEPLLRPDIFEILDFVKTRRYHTDVLTTGILTNGVMLTKDLIDRLSPCLISKRLSLNISLDALSAEIHDSIRGVPGSFDKTLGALRYLSELKKHHPGVNFNVISIILNENLEELLRLAHFLKSLDVCSIQFQPLLSNNLIVKERIAAGKYWISRDRYGLLDKTIDELIEFKRNNVRFVRNSERNLELAKKYCRGTLTAGDICCQSARKTMLIANTGDATTCFSAYGNIREERLRDIWFSQKANGARRKVSCCDKPCLLPCFTDF